LVRIVAPTGRALLQRRDHEIVVQAHLDGPGVVRTGNPFRDLGVGRVGDVENGPTMMPEMAHIEIPAPGHLTDRHLEAAIAAIEIAIADRPHVPGGPALRNRIGECRTAGERSETQQEGSETFLRLPHQGPHFLWSAPMAPLLSSSVTKLAS